MPYLFVIIANILLCNNFARWLQKIVATCESHAMCWFSGMLWSFVTTLCSPNEDFRWPNERLGTHFRSTFSRVSTLFGYVHLKLLRKCVPKCSFGLPKSSFGEHKLYKLITKDNSNMRCVGFLGVIRCVGFLGSHVIRCVGFSGMLLSFVTTLCSPNEDFRKPKTFRTVVLSTFSSNISQNIARIPFKSAQNYGPKCFSVCENLRLGLQKIVATCDKENLSTTFARNSHTGLGRTVYEHNILVSMVKSS